MDQFMKDVFAKEGFSGHLLRCLLFSFAAVASLWGVVMIVCAICTVNLIVGICGTVSTMIWLAWFLALMFYEEQEDWKE